MQSILPSHLSITINEIEIEVSKRRQRGVIELHATMVIHFDAKSAYLSPVKTVRDDIKSLLLSARSRARSRV